MLSAQNPTVRWSSNSFFIEECVVLIWNSGLKPQIYCFWTGESIAMDQHFLIKFLRKIVKK